MVKTHSLTCEKPQEEHTCEFCGCKATRWSQNEGANWVRLGRVVYHCSRKACRQAGQQAADHVDAKGLELVLKSIGLSQDDFEDLAAEYLRDHGYDVNFNDM